MTRTLERLDRKALKQDGLLNAVSSAGDWAQLHLKTFVGALVGVIVVAALAVMWVRDARQKGSQSDQSFSQVVLGYTGGQYERALEMAQALQTQSPGTRAAVMAQYMAGMSQLRLGKFAEAEQSLRGYLQAAAKAPFYEDAARTALAASLEGQGRHADAAALYQEASAKAPEPLASEIKLDTARALRAAGSLDQAKQILSALAADERSAVGRQAKIELAILDNLTAAGPTARP